MTGAYKYRAAVRVYDRWWFSFSATYPFGQVIIKRESITVRIPFFKTVTVKRGSIKRLRVLEGMHGLLWLFAFPGFEVEHTDALLPKQIRINFPQIEDIKNVLQNLGYRCEGGV